MPLVTLDFAPGMRANGTLYQNRNVWVDGDRVRWHHGALRPIGGWRKFQTGGGDLEQVIDFPATEKARAFRAWRQNDGTAVYVVGTNTGLKAWKRGTPTVFDITPAGFTPRPAGLDVADGYGEWFYGLDVYGTARPYDEASVSVFNWCFRNWGEQLLISEREAPSFLYIWDTTLASPAVKVTGGDVPVDIDCFHVTEQRIVMTAGSATEPRLIRWSDVEDYSQFTPSISNQAGFQTLPGIGRFKEIVTVRDQVLLISETDAHTAQYLGPPYVYGFDKIADDCGIISGGSVIATETFAMWPGERGFFIFDGNLRRVPCPVQDRLADLIDNPNAGKVTGFVNPQWTEVWWLYPSQDGDVDRYVCYNWIEDHWQTGTMPRTVGGGHPALGGPILIGQDGYAYNHELPDVVPYFDSPSEVFVESGPLQFNGQGDMQQYISAIVPDMIDAGEVDMYLIGKDRPTAPDLVYGPYSAIYPAPGSQPQPARARGHTVRFRVEGRNSTFTMGSTRLDVVGGGRR